jgi:hypothetical protein
MAEIDPLLRVLFEMDAREFEEVVRLIGKRESATTPEAKGTLYRHINAMLEGATGNVFEIIDLCLPLIDHGVTVFKDGWGTVRGDSGAAISSAIAAVTSGLFIANLNIKWLKGRRYARDNIGRVTALLATLQQKQLAANACITSLNAEAFASIEVEATDGRRLPLELDDDVGAARVSGKSPCPSSAHHAAWQSVRRAGRPLCSLGWIPSRPILRCCAAISCPVSIRSRTSATTMQTAG